MPAAKPVAASNPTALPITATMRPSISKQPADRAKRIAGGPQEANLAGPTFEVQPEQQANQHEGRGDQEEAEREEEHAEVRAAAARGLNAFADRVEVESAAFGVEMLQHGRLDLRQRRGRCRPSSGRGGRRSCRRTGCPKASGPRRA